MLSCSKAFRPHWTTGIVETASVLLPDFSVDVIAHSHWFLQDAKWSPAVAGGIRGWSKSWEEGKGMPWQRWQGEQSPGSLLDTLGWVGTCVQQTPVPQFALGHSSLTCSYRWEIWCSPATKPVLVIRWIVANSASQHFAVDAWVLLAAGCKTKSFKQCLLKDTKI